MDLKTYLTPMTPDERKAFAERCGFSIGHLNNLMYGCKPCDAEYAINIERESGGVVPCEKSAPDVDWSVVRHKARKSGGRQAVRA
jgi:DNA-binding transcriptional regulator YdaS (Cro superfamily)